VTLLGQGVGLADPQRSFPTATMLGFCLGFVPLRGQGLCQPAALSPEQGAQRLPGARQALLLLGLAVCVLGLWLRAAPLQQPVSKRRQVFRAELGASAGSTGEFGLLTLLSHRYRLTCSDHPCPGQGVWVRRKGGGCGMNTSGGWAASRLAKLDFALWCGSAGRRQRAQGTDVLPGRLCPARPSLWSASRSGAVATGTGNSSLLPDLQPRCLQPWLPWLARERFSDATTSFAARGIYDVSCRGTLGLGFYFPPLVKLCKSPVNLKELFGNKNSSHCTTSSP